MPVTNILREALERANQSGRESNLGGGKTLSNSGYFDRLKQNSYGIPKLEIGDDPEENEASVIRAERQRHDTIYAPILEELRNRNLSKRDYHKAFQAGSELVENNYQRTLAQEQRNDNRIGRVRTRAEFNELNRTLQHQKGLNEATVATDTAQALRDREAEITFGAAGER